MRQGLGPARLCALIVSLFMLAVAPMKAEAAEPDTAAAAAVVEKFHGVLLQVMKQAHTLDARARYERLERPIKESYHLALMTQVTCGAFWRKAKKPQRAALVKAFERFSIGTYAYRFDGFSGESFKTISARPGPSGTTLVATQIIRPKDGPVDLTYVLKPFKNAWRIVDVLVAGGVSELAVRRSENQAVLKNAGIDTLVATLNAKADGLIAP